MSLRIIEWPSFLEGPGSLDSASTAPPLEGSAMTIGVFDGVHLGHRELIQRIVSRGPNPTVITFRENPKKIVSPASYEGDIFSLAQKLAAFDKLGVKRVILIDFSEKFSKLSGKEFFNLLEDRGKMVFLAIGADFRCGYRQDTDADIIREMNERKGIPTEVVPHVPLGGANGTGPVSSSRIRFAILSGDLALAAALMGRNVELDLSDLCPLDFQSGDAGGQVYDLRSVRRIVPAAGEYSVLMYPGGAGGRVNVENGKVFLPGRRTSERVERLEFLTGPESVNK